MQQRTSFPVVGVGASAGGLDALQRFFENVNPDCGMAFVVIQHLSPDFVSLMDKLLAKRTKLKVSKIKDKVEVEVNNIYLMSNSINNIVIENGLLCEVEKTPNGQLNFPIDVFFHSLGEYSKAQAIGIILSGTGTDGSRGVRTIKELGGLIYVQKPETAKFNGMPWAAIITKTADSILSPEKIAENLNRYHSIPSLKLEDLAKGVDTIRPNYFKKILQLVSSTSRVNFNYYKKETLLRRIEKRMLIHGSESLVDYYHYLDSHEEEASILFNEFLIGVTRFFRNSKAFKYIKEEVFPIIFNRRSQNDPIRIWVAGCSTGEEAYSVGILLEEYIEEHQAFSDYKIFASDLSKESIEFASQGIYPRNIEADVNPNRLKRYFTANSQNYEIKKRLRERIVFSKHDITSDPPFINTDLVICRNMLIYLNLTMQQEVLIKFHFSLKMNGFLFLGPSESTGRLDLFGVKNSKWNVFENIIAEKRISRNHSSLLKDKVMRELKPYAAQTQNKTTSVSSQMDYISSILISEFTPDCVFVNGDLDVLYINGELESILKFPQGNTELNLSNMLDNEELLLFKSAIRQIRDEGKSIEYSNISLKRKYFTHQFRVKFKVFKDFRRVLNEFFLIEFYPIESQMEEDGDEVIIIPSEETERTKFRTLELELKEAKLKSLHLVEQLEVANEQLQASNEELVASNEELQATNEELQSVNEELYVVNVELQTKISELIDVNNDIDNLLKSTQIGTIFLDKELNIRKFTPSIEAQFSLREADIGRPLKHFTYTFDDHDFFSYFEKALTSKETFEKEIMTKDGDPYLMRVLPYFVDENTVDGVVVTFVNIQEIIKARSTMDLNRALEEKASERTLELKKSNSELKRVNAYLDKFVYISAHDLKSPVNNIKSFSQLLQRVTDKEKRERFISEINNAVTQLSFTIDGLIDMVDFQKNANAEFVKLSFNRIFNLTLEILKLEIKKSNATFSIDFEVSEINYIKPYLQSIFYNLISNAIKYQKEEVAPRVEISTQKRNQYTLLTVKDNGIGMDLDKDRALLFQPFKRLTDEKEGKGVGLSIINEAICKNGGHIEVESEIGKGTTFKLFLMSY